MGGVIILIFDYDCEPKEISAAALNRLWDVCFANSDTFSLSSAPWDGLDDRLERALKPFLLHQMDTMRWFCYYVPDYNKLHMKIYPLNEQTKQILRTHYLGLFLDDWARKGQDWNPSLENICFFRNGKLLLGTVSHEHICVVYPEDEALAQRFKDAVPGWEESDRYAKEQITLPKF